jgi:HK97 family phage prohead protease
VKQDDVRALWNHNSDYVLGRNVSGTLALDEDEHGLRVAITPPDTQWARDLLVSMKRGDVDQMSFGFMTREDAWGQGDDGLTRELIDVDLFDVSVVTYPAYPQTSAEARSKVNKLTAGAADENDSQGTAAAGAALARRRNKIELEKRKV